MPLNTRDYNPPVTKHGAPSDKSVVPGQSSGDIMAYLAAWVKVRGNSQSADANKKNAASCYAAILHKTAPEDRSGSEYAEWCASCNEGQRRLLEIGLAVSAKKFHERKQEDPAAARERMRKRYVKKTDRSYVKGKSAEEKREDAKLRQQKSRFAKAEKEREEQTAHYTADPLYGAF